MPALGFPTDTAQLVSPTARERLTNVPEKFSLAEFDELFHPVTSDNILYQHQAQLRGRAIDTLNRLLLDGADRGAIGRLAFLVAPRGEHIKYGMHANQAFVLSALGGASTNELPNIYRGMIINAMGACIEPVTSYGHTFFALLNQLELFEGYPRAEVPAVGLRHHKIRDISRKLDLTSTELAACARVVIEDNLARNGVALSLSRKPLTNLHQMDLDQVRLLAYEFLPPEEVAHVLPHIGKAYHKEPKPTLKIGSMPYRPLI